MTKSELIDAIVAREGYPRRHVEITINTIFDSMAEALSRSERIEVRGFGNFTVRDYDAYIGRNPKSGEAVQVPKKRMPFFRVGKDLNERINS
jgi:integration host factor subunit beta